MTISSSRLAAALLAACLIAPAAASASAPPDGQATATASKAPHQHSRSGRRSAKSQSRAARRARATRQRNRRLARVRRRKAEHRTVAVNNGVAVASTAAANPEVLFQGDFESAFDEWHLQSMPGRASLTTGSAFQETSAARFEVRPGDVEPETGSQRSEVSGPTFDEGQDLYIRDAIRIPSASDFSTSWQIIQQLHEENWSSSPGLAVFLDPENFLTLGSGDGSTTFWTSGKLQHDRWYDLVYRVDLSQDPGAGFVEVWLDGAQQTLDNGQTRAYGQTIQAAQTYLKAGIYRSGSSSGTSVVEHDDITVGTSYAAVTAG